MTEIEWYEKDLERYINMPIEEKEKIANHIDNIEEKCVEQLRCIQKLKVFFKDVERKETHEEKRKKDSITSRNNSTR